MNRNRTNRIDEARPSRDIRGPHAAASSRGTEAGAEESVVAALGESVRRLRRDGGLTLEELARQSGVSRAMLSKVERGEKSPTLAVVARIARGLNVPLSSLLGGEADRGDVVLIRAARQVAFRDPETGFERYVLSPTHLDNGVEFLLHRIPPGQSSGVLPPYKVPTEKYLVVHEGRLTVVLNDRSYELEAGDALYFEIKAPYRFENHGDKDCAYYLVIARAPHPGVTGTSGSAARA